MNIYLLQFRSGGSRVYKCTVSDVENGRFKKKKNHRNLFCALYNVNKCHICAVSMLTGGKRLQPYLFSPHL